MINNKKIGLALSGGGYRATIYHLGTFRKLKELGILDKIDVISTNSGGSITGATYGLYGDDFKAFEDKLLKGVKSSVIGGVLTSWRMLSFIVLSLVWAFFIVYFSLTSYGWVSLLLMLTYIVVFLFFQFKILPISRLNERMYNKFFFDNKNLSDLSEKVKFAINSTNLETSRLFTFSREKMGDSFYNYPLDNGTAITFNSEKFPIARAVAASTCVPFVFSPVRIHSSFYYNIKDTSRAKPRLVDGGVYDNQGAHKITHGNSSYVCEIVIISDAGNTMPFKHTYKNVLTLLIRTSDIFMNRIKNLQMMNYLYKNHKTDKREIAYQSLGWDLDNSIVQFVDGVKQGVILGRVLTYHGITSTDISENNWKLIEEKIRKSIDYNSIIKDANTEEELTIARAVKTGLSPLKNNQISSLINHAAVLTEIQVKLYCPTLFNK